MRELGLWPVWKLRSTQTNVADETVATSAMDTPISASIAADQRPPLTAPLISPISQQTTEPSDIANLDWPGLLQAVKSCTRCNLHQSRTQGVLGVGDQHADWLIIGEAPGAEEDRQGQPFVGQAGKLLDAMLAAIGQTRSKNVYIANVLKSRPPANRDPNPEEVAACAPYLQRQIELVQPKIILALGRFAAQSLLQTDTPISRLRGQAHTYRGIPLVVTYHPAYLLRNPADKAKVWDDLLLARRTLAAQ